MTILIISHWDTDGIVSSALLCRALRSGEGHVTGDEGESVGPDPHMPGTEEACPCFESHVDGLLYSPGDGCQVLDDRDEKPIKLLIPNIGQYSLSDNEIRDINSIPFIFSSG